MIKTINIIGGFILRYDTVEGKHVVDVITKDGEPVCERVEYPKYSEEVERSLGAWAIQPRFIASTLDELDTNLNTKRNKKKELTQEDKLKLLAQLLDSDGEEMQEFLTNYMVFQGMLPELNNYRMYRRALQAEVYDRKSNIFNHTKLFNKVKSIQLLKAKELLQANNVPFTATDNGFIANIGDGLELIGEDYSLKLKTFGIEISLMSNAQVRFTGEYPDKSCIIQMLYGTYVTGYYKLRRRCEILESEFMYKKVDIGPNLSKLMQNVNRTTMQGFTVMQ